MTRFLPASVRTMSIPFLKEFTRLEYIRILARGWRYIAISMLICLTLAVLSLASTKRMYQATARLLILQQGGPPLANGESSRTLGGDDYLPTHAAILKSPLVVANAIKSVGLENLPTLVEARSRSGQDVVTEALKELTVVRPDRTAQIVCVDYRAGSREEATLMVNAVVDSYQKFLEDKYHQTNSDIVNLISAARDNLRTELEAKEDEYLNYRRDHEITATDEAGRSFMARRLDQWDRASNDAMIKEVQLRSQLEIGRKLVKDGVGMWAVVHAMNQVGGGDSGLLAHAAEPSQGGPTDFIRQLGREQQELTERFGPSYSKVREIQDQMQRIQERARESRSTIDRAEVGELLTSLETSLRSVESMRAEMAKRFDQDQEEAKKAENDLLVEEKLKNNVEQLRSLFNTTVEQLKRTQFVADYNGISAQVIEEANALLSAVRPRVGLTLAIALLFGLVVGSGIAFLTDRMDLLVRTPEHLRELLDMPMLARVPEVTGDTKVSGSLGLISRTAPFSAQSEAFRAVRTSIEFYRRDRPVGVIQVASPLSGDGKSTTASNLAIGFAHAGRRVLLIDADLRKPSQDQIHNHPRDRGLVQVLMGAIPVHRAIRPTSVENLDLIVAGTCPPNPAELLMSPRFAELIDELRQSYDMILIDTSPLLAVTDASIVGSIVDGIVLVARSSSLSQRDAHRVAELLRGIGTPIIGVIANRVEGAHTAYGYGYGGTPEALDDDLDSAAVASTADHLSNGNGHVNHSGGSPEPDDLF